MCLRVVLTVFTVALLGFAPAPFPKTERPRGEDPTDVSGTWEFVLWEASGSREQSTEGIYLIEMKRDKYVFAGKNGGGRTEYEMKLDPAAAPRAFSWSRSNNVLFVGSYRLQKDEMTMIFASGNDLARRPTNFDDKQVQYRFVMKRIRR